MPANKIGTDPIAASGEPPVPMQDQPQPQPLPHKISQTQSASHFAFCDNYHSGDFHNALYQQSRCRRGEVEARVESMWRDIATAPRDPQQWFWALSKRSGASDGAQNASVSSTRRQTIV